MHGNHDGLLQGTVAPDDELRALAVGDARITGLPESADPLVTAEAIGEVGPVRYVHDATSPRVTIAADGGARLPASPTSSPPTTREEGPKYFASDVGRVRLIALDTVNPHGGWQGSLDETQFAWLCDELDAAADRHVVIASHHPSFSLTNDYAPEGAERRVLGSDVVVTLLEHPNVVAWIAGHVHFHFAMRHGDEASGFWEITTSSLIDWPQQARILELVQVERRGATRGRHHQHGHGPRGSCPLVGR